MCVLPVSDIIIVHAQSVLGASLLYSYSRLRTEMLPEDKRSLPSCCAYQGGLEAKIHFYSESGEFFNFKDPVLLPEASIEVLRSLVVRKHHNMII